MPQLSYEKCVQLEALVSCWITNQKRLWKQLWCHQSAISRELSKAKKLSTPYKAQMFWEKRKTDRKKVNQVIHCKILPHTALAIYIKTKLWESRSPEQIANKRILDWNKSISHSAIYSYIYNCLSELVTTSLRRRWKKYKYRWWWKKSKIPNRVSIHDRPASVESRDVIWHFEWDTIVWKNKWDRIATIVDRKSRYLFAGLVMQSVKEMLSINTSIAIFEKLYWLKWLLSITFDNWTEFCDHEYLIEQLKIKTYFADPYSSRQRWTNENTNWLLREFLPKGTDFTQITQAMLDKYVDMINNRPRKCLWWKTPKEMFFWS